MRVIPFNMMASWPTPNYTNPARHNVGFYVLSPLLLTIATICVGARLYGRIFVRRWFGPDDILIAIAWVCTVVVSAFCELGLRRYDWDKHTWDTKAANLSSGLKTLYITVIFWSVASSGVRLSILCLYYRLLRECAPVNKRGHMLALHVMAAVTIGLLVAYVGTGIVPCIPIKAFWTYPAMPGQKCINIGAVYQSLSVVNTVSEFFIALFPIIGAYTLGVDVRQRWHVISLLSLGFLVTIAGGFRTMFVWKCLVPYDGTWWVSAQWLCAEIEINLAMICACVAPLRPLVGRFTYRISNLSRTLTTQVPLTESSKSQAAESTGLPETAEIFENMPQYAYPMSRHIDLEGIGLDDGFGYSVTISGPPATKRRLRRSKTPDAHQSDLETGTDDGPQKLQIETTSAYSVNETYRDAPSTVNQTAGREVPPHHLAQGIDQACQNLSAWGLLDRSISEGSQQPEPGGAVEHQPR